MRALALVVVMLVAACVPGGQVDGAVVPVRSTEPSVPVLAPGRLASPEATVADCVPVELSEGGPAQPDPNEGVVCGFVIVPEDREDPGGPVVELAFSRLRARPPPDVTPSAVSLIVLADGPGDAITHEVALWSSSALRADGDIVLLDARGAGRSFPSLDCGVPPAPGALPLDLVGDCRRELAGEGIVLAAYDSQTMALDVIDTAKALRLDSFNLLGIGHGARVALEVLRVAPPGLRALVLDSPLPPEVDVYGDRPANAQAVLNQLFDECVESRACGRRYAEVRDDLADVVAALNRMDADVEVVPTITGDDLVRATLAAMRGARGPAAVPAALALAVEGAPALAIDALQAAAIGGATVPNSAFSEGLLLSSACRDEVPFGSGQSSGDGLDPVGQAVARDVADLLAACALWSGEPADDQVTEPVEGTVPTLVMSGEFDPLSPASWGAAVAARLPDGQVVQVDGAGHRVNDVDNCTVAIVGEFLRRPRRTINDACARDRVVDFVIR